RARAARAHQRQAAPAAGRRALLPARARGARRARSAEGGRGSGDQCLDRGRAGRGAAVMKSVEVRFLRGPNIHSPRQAFMAIVDLEDLDEVSSAMIPGFTERLVELIPTLSEHRCSTGHRGGFVERLHEGTYM